MSNEKITFFKPNIIDNKIDSILESIRKIILGQQPFLRGDLGTKMNYIARNANNNEQLNRMFYGVIDQIIAIRKQNGALARQLLNTTNESFVQTRKDMTRPTYCTISADGKIQ